MKKLLILIGLLSISLLGACGPSGADDQKTVDLKPYVGSDEMFANIVAEDDLEMFMFTLRSDTDTYEVKIDKNKFNGIYQHKDPNDPDKFSTMLAVPGEYNGKAVTHIAEDFFNSRGMPDHLYLMPGITTICKNAKLDYYRAVYFPSTLKVVEEYGIMNQYGRKQYLNSVEEIYNNQIKGTVYLPDTLKILETSFDAREIDDACLKVDKNDNQFGSYTYIGNPNNKYKACIKVEYEMNLIGLNINDKCEFIARDVGLSTGDLGTFPLPSNLKCIATNAFKDASLSCTSLTSKMILPTNLSYLSGDAFKTFNISGDKSFWLNALSEYKRGYYIGTQANPYLVFVKAKSVEAIDSTNEEEMSYLVDVHPQCISILANAFKGAQITATGSQLFKGFNTVTIPNSVISIGTGALTFDMLNVVQVNLPIAGRGHHIKTNTDEIFSSTGVSGLTNNLEIKFNDGLKTIDGDVNTSRVLRVIFPESCEKSCLISSGHIKDVVVLNKNMIEINQLLISYLCGVDKVLVKASRSDMTSAFVTTQKETQTPYRTKTLSLGFYSEDPTDNNYDYWGYIENKSYTGSNFADIGLWDYESKTLEPVENVYFYYE